MSISKYPTATSPLNSSRCGSNLALDLENLEVKINLATAREIANYLIANDGFDNDGWAHPKIQRLNVNDIEAAISLLQAQNKFQDLKPYHFAKPFGVYNNQTYKDEIIVKKVENLVKNKFDGSFGRFCEEVTQKDLTERFHDMVSGKSVSVSPAQAVKDLDYSPYKVIQRYLELTKDTKWRKGLKKYHLCKISPGALDDQAILDELIEKKLDQLLKTKFNSDLGLMCASITKEDITSPLIDEVNGYSFSVSMGRAAQKFSNSPYKVVKHYLKIKGKEEEFAGFKPYHMGMAPQRTFTEGECLEELIKKKFEHLLETRFDGSLEKLVSEVKLSHLLEPLYDEIGGHVFTVSMQQPIQILDSDTAKILAYYLQSTGQEEELGRLRPYHLSYLPRFSLHNLEYQNELLLKKGDQLLHTKFDGDLGRMCAEVTLDDFTSPLIDVVNGHSFEVSLHTLRKIYGSSNYRLLKGYLELSGNGERFRELKPYHLSVASAGIFNDQSVVDRFILAKFDHLLETKYENNLAALCRNLCAQDLMSPLTKEIGGHVFYERMGAVYQKYRNSPYLMLQRYLELRGEVELLDKFKPYHMSIAPQGSYQDKKFVEGLLVKSLDFTLENKFGGKIERMIAEITGSDIYNGFEDSLLEEKIEISSKTLFAHFNGSPFKVLKRYLELTNRDDLAKDLRPYHLSQTGSSYSTERSVVDELVVKKIDSLLLSVYGGDLQKLLACVSQRELTTPFIDQVGQHQIVVSVGTLIIRFHNSPYEFLKYYFECLGLDFPYTRKCFIGSPATRERRLKGAFSKLDLEKIRKDDGSFETSEFGFSRYASKDKNSLREVLVEIAEEELGDRTVTYLGLETENFDSLRLIRERLNLSLYDTAVVERDPRVANAMMATISELGLENPEEGGIVVIEDTIEHWLEDINAQFNLINLDYVGYLSSNKERALQLLFEREIVDPQGAVVGITLSNSPLNIKRSISNGYEDQAKSVEEMVNRFAKLSGKQIINFQAQEYKGGSNSSTRGSSMLFIVFVVRDQRAD